eukprot:GEMP01053974.1.p1 GENE.GEMP01053974.1~~GEMP01053974.1.p1  ORF type:complete len:207 (+),score=38.17 GEMP01053974.1:179-799(+)
MSFTARAQEKQTAADYQAAYKDSLKNTLRTLAETEDISAQTAVSLNAQTEQLHRIHNSTEEVNYNLDTSQWLLQGMKSWWGRTKNSFNGPPKFNKALERADHASSSRTGSTDAQCLERPGAQTTTASTQQSRTLVGAHAGTMSAQDSEDRDLDQILSMLGNLKSRSHDIGQTLDSHNHMIGHISTKVDTAGDKIAKNTKDIQSLMR